MKKRLAIYTMLAIPLAIFTWYTGSIPIATIVVWGISALLVATYEMKQSGRLVQPAIAVAVFWVVSLIFYSFYWAGIVFLGHGGEQLMYLQIGTSQDWLVQDVQFYQHAILPHVIRYGLLALITGPLFGGGTGWLLIQSKLLQHPFLQKVQQ